MSTSPADHPHVQEENGIARVGLNRPERINALTFEAYRRLLEVFQSFHRRQDLGAVVLYGEGDRGFCSGGDVEDIIGTLVGAEPSELRRFTQLTCDVVEAIATCPIPVIASLHGVVCGAGAVLAAAADLRIATDDTRVAFLFPQVGLSGADMGATYLLPRLVGESHAKELLLLGEFVTAERAYSMGFVQQVVSRGNIANETLRWATQLAHGPRTGIQFTKRMLREEQSLSLHDAFQKEAEVQARCMTHPDFGEAFVARQEGRVPRFLGTVKGVGVP